MLAGHKYDLVLLARKEKKLKEVERELSKYKIKILVRSCDVRKEKDVTNTIKHVLKKFGRIDLLVNNAGYGVYGPVSEMETKLFESQMDTNYFGIVRMTKECLDALVKQKGHIINVASIAGLTGVPRMAGYCATKHAVVGFSESLYYELYDTPVDVSCVCPGKVRTDFFDNESFDGVSWAEANTGLDPMDVAKEIWAAVEERGFLYIIPKRTKRKLFFKFLAPKFLINKMLRKY